MNNKEKYKVERATPPLLALEIDILYINILWSYGIIFNKYHDNYHGYL